VAAAIPKLRSWRLDLPPITAILRVALEDVMGADTAPAVILHAGELPAFPDIDYPWPIKLVGLVALAWLLLGPIRVFLASRRGRLATGLATYAGGAVVATGIWMTTMWGWPVWMAMASGLPLDQFRRFAVALFVMGSQLLGIGAVLAVIAALASYLSMRWGKGQLRQ
jgi:hypothetical protein